MDIPADVADAIKKFRFGKAKGNAAISSKQLYHELQKVREAVGEG